jgi:hypothetical protein
MTTEIDVFLLGDFSASIIAESGQFDASLARTTRKGDLESVHLTGTLSSDPVIGLSVQGAIKLQSLCGGVSASGELSV